MRQRNEETATVRFFGKGGRDLTASALFQRDPQFLKWNRILILGTHEVMVHAMRLQGHGSVNWEVHDRADWPGRGDVKFARRGEGIIRSTGMTQGASIADDSIQPVADLVVHEVIETFHGGSSTKQSAEYWFLQRPRNWPVHPPALRDHERRRVTGRWINIRSSNLRFRLLSTAYHRNDERLSHEIERLSIPGVDIEPIEQDGAQDFASRAEALWFSLRILLIFGLRQYVRPLLGRITLGDVQTDTWSLVEIEPRAAATDDFEIARRPHLFDVLPKGTARILGLSDHQELLHAAAYGYASSFGTFTFETGLTNCVQAIERLLTAFEATRGLSPELLNRKDWRPVSSSLKTHVKTLSLKPKIEARLKRNLSLPMKLSLQERIERMGNEYRQHFDKSTRVVFHDIEKLIKARNDIVHGRLISDGNVLYVELLRAQAIFEVLFVWFLGCKKATTSVSYASSQISYHYGDRERR